MLEGNKEKSSKIEINFVIRDKNGKPTGRRKTFSSDQGNEIASFYNNNKGSKGRSGKRGKSYGRKGKSNGKRS